MATKEGFELRVGIFVFIGLVFLTIMVFSIGDIYIYRPGYSLTAVFGFVNGIEMGAPVRLAGVSIGEVEDVRIFKDKDGTSKVELRMHIRKAYNVERDARAFINTLGLFGEKYVEVEPGDPRKGYFKDGDAIIGNDPVSMERFSSKMEDIANEVALTFASLNDVLGDEKVRLDMKTTIIESRQLVEKMQQLTLKFDSIAAKIDSGQGTVGKLISDDTLYNNLEELSADIKQNPWKLFHRPRGAK